MTAVVYFSASSYASFQGDMDAVLSIRALAPALLLFPIIAMMRGYFQGRRTMMANGISQIVEQIMRLITAVGLTYLLFYKLDWGKTWAIAGASFGGVMGSLVH
jgi:stage V sporulation protein B